MQVTQSTKSQASRSWQQEGAWQNQVCKNKIPTALTSSTWISKAFCVNKARMNHRHQNSSPPNTSNKYHVEAASTWNAVMYDTLKHPNIGDDTAEKLLDQVLAVATICRQHLANKVLMKRLTQEQWREYNNATNFSICTKPFMSADKSVRHLTDTFIVTFDGHFYRHLTGEYRGPAHNTYNLNYHISPKKVKIPCIIHNLKGIYIIAVFMIASFWFSFW